MRRSINKRAQVTNTFNFIFILLIVQGFYSVSSTMLGYALVSFGTQTVSINNDLGSIDGATLNETVTDFQDTVSQQTSIPLLDVGALLFYSGNLILDLLVNFITALPQLVLILINGMVLLFGLDSFFTVQIKLFAQAIFSVFYFILILTTIMNIRSGRVIG